MKFAISKTGRPPSTQLRKAVWGAPFMMTRLAGIIAFAVGVNCCEASAQPHDVSFQAKADGTEQFYMEILPADFDLNKNHDLIIGLHGRGADRSQFATDGRPECAAFRAFAAKYGMIAITPDYRAKTSWMGPKAEADVVQIIYDLKNKYKINRVFVAGASMGGTAAVTFSAIHPDMVDGVTSLNGHANHLEYANFQDEIAAAFGGSKNTIPMEYKKRSAEYWPKVLTMPIAFTVGGKDTVVPPESTIRLAENLKKLNRKVLLLQRPDGGHSTDFADSMAALEFMYGPVKPSTAAGNSVPPASSAVSASAAPAGNWSGIQPALEAQGRVELGLKFSVEKAGKITAFRFYQVKGESGAHDLRLWGADGSLLLTVNAPGKPDAGWISVPLPQPFAASAGNIFVVSYTSNTKYPATPDFFETPKRLGNITAITGVYSLDALGEKAPDKILRNMNYFLDVELTDDLTKPAAASKSSIPPTAPAVSTRVVPAGNWSGIQPALEAQGKVELGLKFSVEKSGKITAFRFYQVKGESGAHDLRLWGADGSLLLTVNAPGKPDAGWISVPLPQPFAASAGNVLVVSYTSNTKYPATPDFFDTPKRLENITAITGVYSLDALGEKAPDKILRNMNYFLDVELE